MTKSELWIKAYLAAITGCADSDSLDNDTLSKIATAVADRAVADFEAKFPGEMK